MNNPVLLEIRQQLLPGDTCLNFPFLFRTPADCALLEVEFSYTPKDVDDDELSKALILDTIARDDPARFASPDFNWREELPLKNLLTISADFNGAYRGCHHRHDPVQRLSFGAGIKDTSEGFYPGTVADGLWRLVLGVHAVMVPCVFTIRVTASKGGL